MQIRFSRKGKRGRGQRSDDEIMTQLHNNGQ